MNSIGIFLLLIALFALVTFFLIRPKGQSTNFQPLSTGEIISNNPNRKTVTQGIVYQRYFNGDPGIAGDIAADANWTKIKSHRNDLLLFKNMKVEALRIYEWNYTVSHAIFIEDLCKAGILFQLPISNYVMGWQSAPYDVSRFYEKALGELTEGNRYKPCLHSIAISNEPDLVLGERSLIDIDRAINDILLIEQKKGITENLPPITVPASFANFENKGPGIYYARKLQELPGVQKLGDRFIYSINTTNTADSIKVEFADRYQKPFMITEWGLTPQNYPNGLYAEALERETRKILKLAEEGMPVKAIFGFLYFKQVQKDGAELNFGFTCFVDSPNIQNCLQNRNCPPHGAKLGLYSDNSLLALAKAYGGKIEGVDFGRCPPLQVIR